MRVAIAARDRNVEELAGLLETSVREVQLMVGLGYEIVGPIASRAYRDRRCRECDRPLPVDARSDAQRCLKPSTC